MIIFSDVDVEMWRNKITKHKSTTRKKAANSLIDLLDTFKITVETESEM